MERLTEWNSEHTHGQLIKGDGYTRLAEYEDTGLTPEEIKGLINTNENLVKQNDKQYLQLREYRTDRDYWKAEALKHCAKLGEIKILMEIAYE